MTNPNIPALSQSEEDGHRLLTRRLLRQLLPVSDMTIWRCERYRGFPEHISIYGRNYWVLREIEQWLAERRRAGNDGAAGNS